MAKEEILATAIVGRETIHVSRFDEDEFVGASLDEEFLCTRLVGRETDVSFVRKGDLLSPAFRWAE
jgi:hypothetical protein